MDVATFLQLLLFGVVWGGLLSGVVGTLTGGVVPQMLSSMQMRPHKG